MKKGTNAKVGFREEIIDLKGMQCKSCVEAVESGLGFLEGMEEFDEQPVPAAAGGSCCGSAGCGG
jgi:hypothetical protein